LTNYILSYYLTVTYDFLSELERIVLTRELPRGIDWWKLLWRADSKAAPIATGYDQPMLPQYRLTPKKIIAAPKEQKQARSKDKDRRKQGTDGQ